MMTPAQVRLNQSPILTNLLLGMGQGTYIAETLFPRLPQALRGITLAKLGNERLKRYNLRRTPGSETKKIEIKFEGKFYTLDQYAVEVPMPRELMEEADESRRLNVGNYLDVSQIAMTTVRDVLAQDYELDVAGLATLPATYAAGHTQAYTGPNKWTATTGTPVTDVRAASDVIRKKIGKRPNKFVLSADAATALISNTEVRTYLPSTQMGPATMDQLKTILEVDEIVRGDAIWVDANDVGQDVWGNNAILAYVPKIGGAGGGNISLAEPAFGFTNVLDGHPYSETPVYREQLKSWIYGGTFERRPNVAYNTAAFLFQNPK